ncbi:MAG: helix-turn-helix domain-containing protein, partial [Alphaproteobacteria bacterium]|nr:helix-turn-helix domain-containing protein [Alphaproteobacteria bacterium]
MQHLTLAEISEKLKSQRLDRDFTLEQVEEQTKISKRFIIAIEESKFDVFPALMYLYGFVTNLCELYQIDSEQILNSLKYQLTASNQEETAASEDVETHLQDKQQPPLRGKSNAKIAIYSLSIVLILLIVFVVKVSLNENPQITSITLDNVVTQATIYKMNSEKETFDLKLKDSVNILFDNSYQKLVIDSIADNEVKFYLNDIEFKLNEAAQQSLDLNEDEIDDIETVSYTHL